MAILSKVYKPDNFESHNSLKLSFTNTRGLRSNFADCESYLESNCPDILALCETNRDDSIDSGNFSVRGYLIELLGLLIGLGLLALLHLIYPRLLTGFGMLVSFTNFNLMKFQVRYIRYIDGFE